MTRKEVIIGQGRLDVIRTYLADKVPQGARSRGEWARCMAILSAQRKEAPEAQSATRDCPHCWNCDKALLCARCGEAVEAECREEQEAAERAKYPAQRKEAPQPDDAAGKCGDCELRGQCDEDILPGGCPKEVGKTVGLPEAQPEKLSYHLNCINCGADWRSFVPFPAICPFCRVNRLAQTSTSPPHFDPATVAFPFREKLETERQTIIAAFLRVDRAIKKLRGEIGSTMTHTPCSTCRHRAVCRRLGAGTAGTADANCESWEGEHPR
jgi:hypothetical protein